MLNAGAQVLEAWKRSVRHGDDFYWLFIESGGSGGQFARLMVALHPLSSPRGIEFRKNN